MCLHLEKSRAHTQIFTSQSDSPSRGPRISRFADVNNLQAAGLWKFWTRFCIVSCNKCLIIVHFNGSSTGEDESRCAYIRSRTHKTFAISLREGDFSHNTHAANTLSQSRAPNTCTHRVRTRQHFHAQTHKRLNKCDELNCTGGTNCLLNWLLI